MKFAAILRENHADMPEIASLFTTYKQLKKKLKALPERKQENLQDAAIPSKLSEEEAAFIAALDNSLAQINAMFMEREEEAVIRLERLQRAAEVAHTAEAKRLAYKRLVDFHGEVLLLVHWSTLAYTATVKILKKHHKRTGLLLRAPHMEGLLNQPFCSTEVMTDLARRAEASVQQLASALSQEDVPCISTCQVPDQDMPHVHPAETVQQLPHLEAMEEEQSSVSQNDEVITSAVAAVIVQTPSHVVEAVQTPTSGSREVSPSDSDDAFMNQQMRDLVNAHQQWAQRVASRNLSFSSIETQEPAAAAAGAAESTIHPVQASRMDILEDSQWNGANETLRKAQVALNTWTHLRTTASTPSTVLSPTSIAEIAHNRPPGGRAPRRLRVPVKALSSLSQNKQDNKRPLEPVEHSVASSDDPDRVFDAADSACAQPAKKQAVEVAQA